MAGCSRRSCPLALGSFRLSTAIFASTASADSSRALAPEVSPGKVHELSARAVRLYQMRLSVTVGFRVSQHAHRPHLGLTACSSSYGRAFVTAFFRAECLAAGALAFATIVVTQFEHFHFALLCLVHAHAGHTGRGLQPRVLATKPDASSPRISTIQSLLLSGSIRVIRGESSVASACSPLASGGCAALGISWLTRWIVSSFACSGREQARQHEGEIHRQ